MIKSNKKGKTLTIKIKYDDFKQQTRSRTLDHYIYTKNDFYPIIEDLIYSEKINKPVRLLGISISNFLDETKKSQEKIQLEFKF
jgi:DNA polymerase-4